MVCGDFNINFTNYTRDLEMFYKDLLVLTWCFRENGLTCLLKHTLFAASKQIWKGQLLTPEGPSSRTGKLCTIHRIEGVINIFQPYKSRGTNGIFPVLLQKGKEETIQHLVNITRRSLTLGYISKSWRWAKVTFIPKIGKEDGTNLKSFRLISLISFLLKAMLKVIGIYIRMKGMEKTPLHKSQHIYSQTLSLSETFSSITSIIPQFLSSLV